jgi:hypothetical protein
MDDDASEDQEGVWCVVANVKREHPWGEGGVETKDGTRQFRGGTKVYIGGCYPGTCDGVVCIGLHRKSRRFITCVVNVAHLEDFRPKIAYHPEAVRRLRTDERCWFRTKDDAETWAATFPEWQAMQNPAGRIEKLETDDVLLQGESTTFAEVRLRTSSPVAMKNETGTAENRPRDRLADSPWFWVCLFASVAVMGLVAIGPKYQQREARLETQLKMRDHLSRGNHAAESSEASGDLQTNGSDGDGQDELLKTTGPLIWILVVVVVGAWGLLIWSRRTVAAEPKRTA